MGGCRDLLDPSALFGLSGRATRDRLSDEKCKEGDDDDDEDVELPDRDGDVDDSVGEFALRGARAAARDDAC